jgi:nitric oxide dioxygenase
MTNTRRGVMTLSPESESIVHATAGVVAQHADEITTLFYREMFAAHPELLRVFNRANQAIGEQPKALAASVVAFAVHLIDPEAPDFTPIMQRIAHKHVSLGIQARQYTIVGHHLLDAVGVVLGDAVTPEVRAAWDEVYWLFGCSLIAEEAKLYALGGTDPEQPWRAHRVVERIEESPDVISLLLAPVTGPRGDTLRVTIKRVRGDGETPAGQVSTWLHENAHPGTVLDVSQPAGDVVLDDAEHPLVLVSAGIGITPIAAILEDLSRRSPSRTVRLFHADRAHDTHALYATLRRQVLAMEDARAQNWYESDAELAPTLHPALPGRMDLAEVELPDDAVVFMCGPLAFMRAARETLMARGVPADRISYEVFGPDLWARQPGTDAA